MTLREFRQRCAATGIQATGQTGEACRLVLVGGLAARVAATEIGINEAAVSRALAKLRRAEPADGCPHCGRPI